ncbi:MAG: tetratricopeptide repeat protein, partial [Bacteroidetes bacterium]|nr:tetratricopeptide repeat protein [Bacteroidota bacterium]
FLRGKVNFLNQKYDGAMEDLNHALRLDPLYGEAYYHRAGVYQDLGQYDKALSDMRYAQSLGVQIDPAFINMVLEGNSGK